MASWASIDDIFWKPISFFKVIPLQIKSPELFRIASHLWFLSLLFSCAGLFTYYSTKVSFLLGMFNIGYPYNFGKIDHSSHFVVIVLFVLAISKCADTFSIDSLIKRNSIQKSGEYSWPIQLIKTMLCLTYFEAGFQKLRVSGLEWIYSNNIQNLLLHWKDPEGVWVAKNFPFACKIFAAMILIPEILAPLALFYKKMAIVLVPCLFSIHFVGEILIGDPAAFTPLLICYIFWIPWAALFNFFTFQKSRNKFKFYMYP